MPAALLQLCLRLRSHGFNLPLFDGTKRPYAPVSARSCFNVSGVDARGGELVMGELLRWQKIIAGLSLWRRWRCSDLKHSQASRIGTWHHHRFFRGRTFEETEALGNGSARGRGHGRHNIVRMQITRACYFLKALISGLQVAKTAMPQ